MMLAVAETRKYSCGVRIAEVVVVLGVIIGVAKAGFDFALVHALATSQTSSDGAQLANFSKEAGWLGICACIALILRVCLTGYLFRSKSKMSQASYRSMLTWFLMFSGPAAFCIEDSTSLIIMAKLELPQIAVPWVDQAAWEASVNASTLDSEMNGGYARSRRQERSAFRRDDTGDDSGSGSGNSQDSTTTTTTTTTTIALAATDENVEVSAVIGTEQFRYFNSLVGTSLVSGSNWNGVRASYILATVSAFLSAFGIFWVLILLCGDEPSDVEVAEGKQYAYTDELETEEAEELAEYVGDDELFQCCVMLMGFVFIIVPALVLAGVQFMWLWFAIKALPSGSMRDFPDDDFNEFGLGLGTSPAYHLHPDEVSWDIFYRNWVRAGEEVDFENDPVDIDSLKLGLGYGSLITAYAFGWLFTFFGSFAICCCVDFGSYDPDLHEVEVKQPANGWDTSKWTKEAEQSLEDAQDAARTAIAATERGGGGGGGGGGGDGEGRREGVEGGKEGRRRNASRDDAGQGTDDGGNADELVDGNDASYTLASATPAAVIVETASVGDRAMVDGGYQLASATPIAETALDEILPARIERIPTIKLSRNEGKSASKI